MKSKSRFTTLASSRPGELSSDPCAIAGHGDAQHEQQGPFEGPPLRRTGPLRLTEDPTVPALGRATSGWGQTRQSGDVRSTSDFALEADINTKPRDVSKVPTADSCTAA